jgi:hypothetical protein
MSRIFCVFLRAIRSFRVFDVLVCCFAYKSFMGAEVLLHDEKKAEELFEFGLKVCGITEADLPCLKKGD